MTKEIGLSPLAPAMSLKELAEVAAFADAAGYSSLWTTEATGRDAFTVLTVWAMQTTRIELGTGVVTIYARPPTAAAMHTATLSELAPDRVILGIGSGHTNIAQNAFGFHNKLTLNAVANYGDIVRRLLDGGDVVHEGPVFTTSDAVLGRKPTGDVPLILGALGPNMSALAATNFDGVLWNWLTPETMSERTTLANYQIPTNRRDFHMRTNVRVAVHEQKEDARRALAAELLRYCSVQDYRRFFRHQGLEDMLSAVDHALAKDDAGKESAILLLEKRSELDLLGIADTAVNARARIRELQAETDIDLMVRPVVWSGHDVWSVVTALAPSAQG